MINRVGDNMSEDKKEVLVEKEYMITTKYNSQQENITRCSCGSSLVRIVNEPIIKDGKEVGREYTVICAECGEEVFGFTDIWECKHCAYHINKNNVDIKTNFVNEDGIDPNFYRKVKEERECIVKRQKKVDIK